MEGSDKKSYPSRMDYKRDYEKLIKKAESLPGVAELVTAYKRLAKSYEASQKYLHEIEPEVVVSASDTSAPAQSLRN